MGNLFRSPKLKTQSLVTDEQGSLFPLLRDYASGIVGTTPMGFEELQESLLASGSNKSRRMSKEMFSDAFLGPALREFDTEIAPRINASFGRIGGTLSSRRTKTLADALADVETGATGQLASLLPTIESFPLAQTLSQIQGLTALDSLRYDPYEQALKFAVSPVLGMGQQSAGAGWGLLSTLLEGGTTYLTGRGE